MTTMRRSATLRVTVSSFQRRPPRVSKQARRLLRYQRRPFSVDAVPSQPKSPGAQELSARRRRRRRHDVIVS